MNRLQAILMSLFLLVFVQYAQAGVVMAAGAGAGSDSTEGYRSDEPRGTGEAPESVEPNDNPAPSEAPSGSTPGYQSWARGAGTFISASRLASGAGPAASAADSPRGRDRVTTIRFRPWRFAS